MDYKTVHDKTIRDKIVLNYKTATYKTIPDKIVRKKKLNSPRPQ